MSVRLRLGVSLVAALTLGLLVWVGNTGDALAAGAGVVKRIESINNKAIEAYTGGDSEKAKELLMDAVVLGKENGLAEDPALARTYLNLGLIHIEGLKDEEKGARYFTLALRIDPSIKMKSSKASADVTRAFEQAQGKASEQRAKDTADEVAAGMAEEAAGSTPPPVNKRAQAREERLRQAQLEREKKAEQDEILKELADTRQREAREQAEERRQAALEREQAKKERERKAREDQEKVLAELAAAKEREAKERAQRERDERQELERNLKLAAEREKKDLKDKEKLREGQQELEKRLAETQQREKAERAAREQLARQKDELEKQLAAEKVRLEKETKAMAAQLAAAAEREKKERAILEDLQEEKRLTVVREADARKLAQAQKAAKEKEMLLRAKLAEGPEMPAKLTAPLQCQTTDETAPETDVYIHCAAQPRVKAEAITLHYRPSGSARFHSMAMERKKTGWHTAMVPAALIKGRMLQYYVQAENARGRTAASNGKAASPNVIMINRWPKASAVAAATTTPNAGSGDLVRASSRSARKVRTGRRR